LFLQRYRDWLTLFANSKDAQIIVGAERSLNQVSPHILHPAKPLIPHCVLSRFGRIAILSW